MKRVISLILSLAMVFAFATTAFAAGEGSITIDNAVVGQTYSVYRIFDIESYSDADGDGEDATDAYAYTVNSAWTAFINGADIKGVYVNVDAQGYVTWVEGANAATFAELAQAYAKTNNIAAVDSKEAATATVEFTGLDLGYYLVDTTLGVLCALDTTNPNVTMKEKNVPPTITKDVQEDSNGVFGDSNDAAFHQTVVFQAFINIKAGGQNYAAHDRMSKGLTYNGVKKVEIGTLTGNTFTKTGDVPTDKYTVTAAACGEGDCKYETDCTFKVEIDDGYVYDKAGQTIRIEYEAVVNEEAVVESVGNPNDIYLVYGDENETEKDTTVTYVHEFELFKYDMNAVVEEFGEQNEYTQEQMEKHPLDGAEFKLYDELTGGNEIPVVNLNKDVDGNPIEDGQYRLAKAGETGVVIKTVNGKAVIRGFDSTETGKEPECRYFVEETKAPTGYNRLPARIEVVVTRYEPELSVNDNDITKVEIMHIGNRHGSELPSTGGVGTTMFYLAGAAMVLGSAVTFVTKKRLGDEE